MIYSADAETIDSDEGLINCQDSFNRTERLGQKVNASASVGHWPPVWIDGSKTWLYEFKIVGMFKCEGTDMYGEGPVSKARFEIRLDNPSGVYLSNIDHPDYVWSTTSSSPRINSGEISLALIDVAMGLIKNAGVSLAWTVALQWLD